MKVTVVGLGYVGSVAAAALPNVASFLILKFFGYSQHGGGSVNRGNGFKGLA